MIKIQIKSIWGEVLFEYEKEDNTIKNTLEEAVRRKISLNRANLDGANLYGANLNRANLYGANLYGANLYGANLNRANLYGANLYGANLDRANLNGANLDGANLYGASLNGASNIPFIPYACPSDGAFIGWKKVNNHLVMLEIPEDARRCSSTSQKCRCDKAKVLSVLDMKLGKEVSEVVNHAYNQDTLYKVGEIVYPDSFDENRWIECSHGIHFFINRQNAIDY